MTIMRVGRMALVLAASAAAFGASMSLPVSAALLSGTHARGHTCTITDTSGSDRLLEGTEGDDVICGLGGADKIKGLGGDDIIYGGSGRDLIYGHAGDDIVGLREGSDEGWGGPGRDGIAAIAGSDVLHGGRGRDSLCAHDEMPNDTLLGGPNRDRFYKDDGDIRRSVDRFFSVPACG